MKKFTKLFLSCMAVSAITAAVATSAMAADLTGDVKGSYDESGKLTITNLAELGIKEGTQATILVVGPNADLTAITEGKIEYINQDAQANVATAWGTVGLKSAPAEEKEETKGTYTVMVGYEPAVAGTEPFVVAKSTFTIGASQLLVGDVNGDARINGPDAVAVLTVQAGDDTAIAEEYVPAAYYCNGDFRIGGPDAVEILTYQAGDENREYVGKTMAIPAAPAN